MKARSAVLPGVLNSKNKKDIEIKPWHVWAKFSFFSEN